MAPLTLQETRKKPDTPSTGVPSILVRLGILVGVDVIAFWFLNQLFSLGFIPLAVAFLIITLFINIVLLFNKMYPIRWMVIGFVFMGLFTIYPIVFTVWIAFTNYGGGHLITKEQAIEQILDLSYLPETGRAYSWTAFKSPEGEYALWLIDSEGVGHVAKVGEPLTEPQLGEQGIGELDSKGIPESIEGYQKLNAILAATDKTLPDIQFGVEGNTIQIRSPSEAAELVPTFTYDAEQDAMLSNADGSVYRNVDGVFTSNTGEKVIPGFVATIGWENFRNFFVSPALRGPLVRIITWNFAFAFFSVLVNFGLGLAIAIMFNDPKFPFKKVIRSLLLVPYTIPALITIVIWRGMMNPEIGVINRALESWFGWAPHWFNDQWWAKIAILIVNLWLSYPYFMLVCSGALQSISEDIYQAAEVDGASPWQKFWSITLPLLLVAVGPLLVASFTFNFNNFNLIYLFIGGGPPIAGASTAAGHTDLLISYVYKLAFASGRGINYGLGSAITIVIFFFVGAITLFQFRYTRMWEEVSENV